MLYKTNHAKETKINHSKVDVSWFIVTGPFIMTSRSKSKKQLLDISHDEVKWI